MLNELSPWHLLIILLLFALLFGGRRLPDAARGLGRSLRIFKSEMSAAKNEEASAQQQAPTTSAPVNPFTAQSPAPAPAQPTDSVAPAPVPTPEPVAVQPVTVEPVVAQPEPVKKTEQPA